MGYRSKYTGAQTEGILDSVSTHINNDSIHVTSAEKTAWDNKVDESDLGSAAFKDTGSTSNSIPLVGETLQSGKWVKVRSDMKLGSADLPKVTDGVDGLMPYSAYTKLQGITVGTQFSGFDNTEVNGEDLAFNLKGVDLSAYATSQALNTHTSNTDIHVTSEEKENWGNVYEDWENSGTSITDLNDGLNVAINGLNDHVDDTDNPHQVTKSQVGLGNVDNVQQIPLVQKGVAGGVAELDVNGKVPSSQLPSYVDDVVEFTQITDTLPDDSSSPRPSVGQIWYLKTSITDYTGKKFYRVSHIDPVTFELAFEPESGKVYVNTTDNTTWRWSGVVLSPIKGDLALGETSSTAYRGDRGKIAYDHSQTTGNPHGTTIANISGLQDALDDKADSSDLELLAETVNAKPDGVKIGNGTIIYPTAEGDNEIIHLPAYPTVPVISIDDDEGTITVGDKTLGSNDSPVGVAYVALGAEKVEYLLKWSGYSSGSYDGSAEKTITIPTTLPASDVYDWAKQPAKPSYSATEISGLGTAAVKSTGYIDESIPVVGETLVAGQYVYVRNDMQLGSKVLPVVTSGVDGLMPYSAYLKLQGITVGTQFSGFDNTEVNGEDLAFNLKAVSLATVATSGSYNDLIDKPTIPESVIVDDVLSTTSIHPVQNKIITTEIRTIQNSVQSLSSNKADKTATVSDITFVMGKLKKTINGVTTEVTTISEMGHTGKLADANDLGNTMDVIDGRVEVMAGDGLDYDSAGILMVDTTVIATKDDMDGVAQTVKVGNVSYTAVHGVVSLPAYPTAPNVSISNNTITVNDVTLGNSSNAIDYANKAATWVNKPTWISTVRPTYKYGDHDLTGFGTSAEKNVGYGEGDIPIVGSTFDGGTGNILIIESRGFIGSSSTLPASKVSGLAAVATSGNYNDLSNKPVTPNTTLQLVEKEGVLYIYSARSIAGTEIRLARYGRWTAKNPQDKKDRWTKKGWRTIASGAPYIGPEDDLRFVDLYLGTEQKWEYSDYYMYPILVGDDRDEVSAQVLARLMSKDDIAPGIRIFNGSYPTLLKYYDPDYLTSYVRKKTVRCGINVDGTGILPFSLVLVVKNNYTNTIGATYFEVK